MNRPVLFLGKADSDNIKSLILQCEAQKQDYLVIDTQKILSQSSLFFDDPNDLKLRLKKQEISLNQVSGIFWDSIAMPLPSKSNSHFDTINTASFLQVLLQQTQLNWVNSWQAFQDHKTKPLQLKKAENLGASIPKSYFGNDEETAIKFIHDNQDCIVKPIHGGQHTESIDVEQLSYLAKRIKASPVCLQERIEGTNIRSYVIGKTLFSAEIRSDKLDFREDAQIKIIPLIVPKAIEQLAYKITTEMNMQWTAIDWRRDPFGHYVFLEANPAPRFTEFSAKTGYPIAEYLFALLCNKSIKNIRTS